MVIKTKKGTVFDIFTFFVIMFILAVGVLIMHFFTNTVIDRMVANPTINASGTTVTALNDVKDVTSKYDMFGVAMFIGLFLAIIVTGYFIGGYAFFMFVYFVLVVLAVLVSAVLSNVWETISSVSVFNTTLSAMPMTNHIILNFPYYIAIVGFVGIIVMFAKPQQ